MDADPPAADADADADADSDADAGWEGTELQSLSNVHRKNDLCASVVWILL